jgi:hypothetical protein
LIPIAKGAWCRSAAPAVAICNTIPRFGGRGEAVTLADCDPYFLFHEPEEETGGRMPYNPELLAAIASGQTRLTAGG